MKNQDILSGLNQEQLTSVVQIDKAILILAGAGSGKTKVLTTRIAWLIQNYALTPREILAVTFTNKAAQEMLHRVSSLININISEFWIGTFHSISLKLLSTHHNLVNLKPYFHILDNQDQFNLVKRIVKDANLDENRYSAKELQKFINTQKELGLRADNLSAYDFRQEKYIQLYQQYEQKCLQNNLVDFTELLLRSFELLTQNQNILFQYHGQFKHILVDEFQDTNSLQYKWLSLFKSNNSSIFAVGDDDQSIYSFRGALSHNIKKFIKDFSVDDPILLEQNYRSTTNILSAANQIIKNNSTRIGKNLWTNNGVGDKIKLFEGYTENDEALFVLDEIEQLMIEGTNLSDIAILYRSNAQSRIFEQLFHSKGIAYRVHGGLKFFDRVEIKQIIAYLRLIMNSDDNDAFLKIINFPIRGIGSKTIESIKEIASLHNCSLFAACNITPSVLKENVLNFVRLIRHIQITIINFNLYDAINCILSTSGILEHYRNDKNSGTERVQNLNEFINSIINFNSYNNDNINNKINGIDLIADFLTYTSLNYDFELSGKKETSHNAVQLMTIHAAKGLEFKTVFIVGLENGLFPHESSIHDINTLEEERRLMYVAITRAKEKLYLLRACSRLMWGQRNDTVLSMFIKEIPKELIANISSISNIGYDTLSTDYHTIADTNLFNKYNTLNPETQISNIALIDKNLNIRIGDIVEHNKFGQGKIVHLDVCGLKVSADIVFFDIGKKTLNLNIANIKKITKNINSLS